MNKPICADRSCKKLEHGHSWMPTRGKVTSPARSKALEKKKGHIGTENSHFHYDKNKSHYEPEAWNKKALRSARKDGSLTRHGEEILGRMK